MLGNKFSVSFKHILWIVFFCLFATKYKEILSSRLKKWGIVITLYSILISLFIDCMTGVIGCLIVLFMIIYQTKLQPLVNKKYTIILCFVLSAIFVFFVSFVMSNELVVYLVTSVFKRDITLTGRTDLYLMMFNIIKDRLLFGYGYGSSIIITPLALNYGNIQNAFWDLVMQIGLVGLAFVFVFINLIPIKSRNYYIMMYLLALIITGTVEITYGASFIIYIYYSIILDKNNKNKISLGK